MWSNRLAQRLFLSSSSSSSFRAWQPSNRRLVGFPRTNVARTTAAQSGPMHWILQERCFATPRGLNDEDGMEDYRPVEDNNNNHTNDDNKTTTTKEEEEEEKDRSVVNVGSSSLELSSNNQNKKKKKLVTPTIPGSQKGGKKLAVIYTCKVCDTRSAKQFTEQAYRHGVVVVRCPGCGNQHLIADRLGFFQDESWDVEQALAQAGESVKAVTNDNVLEVTLQDLMGDKLPPQLQQQQQQQEEDATKDDDREEMEVAK